MIPRILHRIWLGSPVPDEYEAYWREWKRLMPTWAFCTWQGFDRLINQCEFDEAESFAQKADIARYEVLLKWGGVYVDCDVEPLRSLEPLLETRCFIGRESEKDVCNAVIGAEPGYELMKDLVDGIPLNMTKGGAINQQTGPMYLLDRIQSREWDGLTLHEPCTFYPYHWSERDPGIYPDESYTVHHWRKSWI